MSTSKINIVVVGLVFGNCFVESYKLHPNVASVGICDRDESLVNATAETYGITKTYKDLDEVLRDETVDAVHIVTPPQMHEEHTVAVLNAGKHCACAVPMAVSLDGIRRITEAARKSGKNYMMMETTLFTYQFFYVKQMIESGELGRIQFMRGSHYQDIAGWPGYWKGLPPMHYGTHAIGPMLALSGSRIERVRCIGAGTMAAELHEPYGNPFPVESAHIEFENGLKGEATRSLFETAREYQEGLFVYGSEKSFEWGFADGDSPYVTTLTPPAEGQRGGTCAVEVVEMQSYNHLLPEPLQKIVGWHHGAHPHLVNEFVASIAEGRKPWIDEVMAGNMTAAGICAHDSAMNDGAVVDVPVF